MQLLPLADDCGVSEANTADILECIDAGSLLGTSLLACGNALETAVKALAERQKQHPGLRVGVHLNLLEGKCSASPEEIPMLVDSEGSFRHSLGSLWYNSTVLNRKKRSQICAQVSIEWQAQINKIKALMREALGREPVLYLDGHQHIHAIPALHPAICEILQSNKFIHVRVPAEPHYFCPAPVKLQMIGTIRREILSFWGKSLVPILEKFNIPYPNHFIGAFASGCMTAPRLQAGLNKTAALAKKDDVVEIMFHPGGYSATELQAPKHYPASEFSKFYSAPERQAEKSLLLSPVYKTLLTQNSVKEI